ncbi:MAG TPA: hypothetical protein DEQ61_23770, partial [Streptomyces sp.]|nr:hypothetical protein [Streptomyces sp.]
STASNGGNGGGAPAAEGDPPPLQLDGYGQSKRPGIAPGEPDPSGVSYVATGELPDGPEKAPVHHARGEVDRQLAERLAKALDVPGAPRLVDGTWKFGLTRDASGPTLDVAKKAPGTWTYNRYGKGGGAGCEEPSTSGPKGDKGEGVPSARCPEPGGGPSDGGADKAVPEAEAKRAAEPVLEAIGLGDAKLNADETMGAVRQVNAEPVLDGLPSYGWQTGLQVGADGELVGGSGRLAELTKGAEYPVLNAEQTLKRLNDSGGGGEVGIGGCASPVPHGDPGGSTTPESQGGDISTAAEPKDGDLSTASEPCESAAGTPAEPAKVRDAVFGQAVQFVAGKPAMVPSWLFEVEMPGATGPENTYTVTHPAVAPEYIAEPDEPGTGEKKPSEPGGSGSPVDIESYSVDGRTLTLRFWGGVCTDYSASAESAGDKVTAEVTGVEKDSDRACIKIAKLFEKKVTLDKPLGDREVADAAGGEDVPRKK